MSFQHLSNLVMILAETNVEAGDFIVSSDGNGFATDDAKSGDLVEIETGGIFILEVLASDDINVRDPIYFADGSFSTAGDLVIGHAYDPATPSDGVAYIAVKLGA